MTEFRDSMLERGTKSIRVSNPVLEEQGEENTNRKFITCSKEAAPLQEENIVF